MLLLGMAGQTKCLVFPRLPGLLVHLTSWRPAPGSPLLLQQLATLQALVSESWGGRPPVATQFIQLVAEVVSPPPEDLPEADQEQLNSLAIGGWEGVLLVGPSLPLGSCRTARLAVTNCCRCPCCPPPPALRCHRYECSSHHCRRPVPCRPGHAPG